MFNHNGHHWAHNITNPISALTLIARYRTELETLCGESA